ncbi:hypothetical protein Cgig2_016788 [Carnegiea gigantea]|uniref:rRNA N-glycosylase n=1 Tax=Carnegiea gigantea TaxID=171969 RepID=A0A9Q1GZ66_9CARY|nr:hypothetical protein Cgig2_016788 [Carnegiea gigantea]
MNLALALVVVMSTWAMLMFAATSREITKPKSPPPPPPSRFPTPVTMPGFALGGSDDAASYSKFIGDLRNKLKDPQRSYFEVPMIRFYPRLQYMYVELKSAAENTITLAIRMDDLYVVGYSYKYKGRELRARFLKLEDPTIQAQVKENLFPDATNNDKDIGYEGSYDKLEEVAKKNRMDLDLGSQALETYIYEITYKNYSKAEEFRRTEARLLLIVIQMVSEAIRFKYIENKIKDNFYTGYAPDPRAIDLEKNWEKLTKVIMAANPQTGEIPKKELDSLKLSNPDGTPQNIRNVYSITVDMGLLKYIAASSSLLATMQYMYVVVLCTSSNNQYNMYLPSSSSKWLMMQLVDNDTFLGGIATRKQHEGGASCFGGATATSSEINAPKSPPPPPPRPQPIELDLGVSPPDVAEAKYSDFIATLLLKLKDPKESRFGIPILRKLSQSEYMYVKLISAQRNSIELAIDKKYIYVVGYSYKNGDEVGARFFKDIDKNKYKDILPEAKIRGKENIGSKGVYDQLQAKAGVGTQHADRRKVQLGMKALGSFIDDISATHPSNIPKAEAKLLLIAIQMVSEAVRFKYIMNQAIANIPNNFNPDYKVISLERYWGQLSKAIAAVKSETESFKEALELWDPQGNQWVVRNVKDIKEDMGLLNSIGASELPKWLLDDNPCVLATSLLATM